MNILLLRTFLIFEVLIILAIIFKKKYSKKIVRKHFESEDINESFEKIHNKIDKSQIKKLEKTRKILIILQVVIVLSIIIPIILILSNKVILKVYITKIAIVTFLVMASSIYLYIVKKIKYKENYKNIIISNIVKAVNPNLQYTNESNIYTSHISQKAYDSAKFDNKKYNRYECDDCIEGVLENSNIRIEDIQTKLINSTGKNTTETIMFEGIFVEMDCNKNINNSIKIVRDKVSFNNVKMDSSEFEKYFDVFTEDRVLAMRILTHDVMESLVKFYDKIKYEIVIKENKIYLRFFTGQMFEPRIYGKVLDKGLITTYYSILSFIVDVTSKINKEIQNLEI